MKGILLRLEETEHQTRGDLMMYDGVDRIWECRTLELPWRDNEQSISCIPPGRYQVTARHSPRYGRHFHVLDVFGRSLILIHPGNYAAGRDSDTRGCILVGRAFSDINGDGHADVIASRDTMRQLKKVAPDDWTLDVISAGGD